MLLNIFASSQDGHTMSLDVLPEEENEINELNCILLLNDSYSNTSGDSLYQTKKNSDIVPSHVTLINYNKVYHSTLSKSDWSSLSDDINIISHYNYHVCESIDSIDVVTAVDMVISMNNPLISVNYRYADHHELTSSNTLVLSNGSQPNRDQYIDDQFSTGINHTYLSSTNLPVATDSGCNIYATNSNS